MAHKHAVAMATDSGKAVDHRNTRVAVMASLVAAGMLAMAYAAVPLYQLFCQVTGYGGTIQRASVPSAAVLGRTMTIRFDANVNGLDWAFKPVERKVVVRIGENALAFYRVTNQSNRPLAGTATFNVSPAVAGAYFNKLDCFCFTEQRLEPGQSMDMPVSFFVDPAIVEDWSAQRVSEITLSYTFYPVAKPSKAAAAADPDGADGG